MGVPAGRSGQREGCRKTSSAPFEGGVLSASGKQKGRGLGASKGAAHPTGTVLSAGDIRINKRDKMGLSQSLHSAESQRRQTWNK